MNRNERIRPLAANMNYNSNYSTIMKTYTQVISKYLPAIITVGILNLGCEVENSSSGGNSGGAKAKVGEKVTFDDSEWTVTSARNLGGTLTHEFFDNKQSEGNFIKVEFTVKNTTNEEDSIADSPVLIDDQGRKFSMGEELVMFIPGDAKTITLEALPPGLSKKFQAIYEVPDDAKGLAFRARELGFSPDYKLIDLGMDNSGTGTPGDPKSTKSLPKGEK